MTVDRSDLRALLWHWETGGYDERRVHEEAERLWERAPQDEFPWKDPRSIPAEVLTLLETLNQSMATPEDIPAMRAFLDTPLGAEVEGWERWQRYWDTVDFRKRAAALAGNPYYSAGPQPRAERSR